MIDLAHLSPTLIPPKQTLASASGIVKTLGLTPGEYAHTGSISLRLDREPSDHDIATLKKTFYKLCAKFGVTPTGNLVQIHGADVTYNWLDRRSEDPTVKMIEKAERVGSIYIAPISSGIEYKQTLGRLKDERDLEETFRKNPQLYAATNPRTYFLPKQI
jgi:hypothetical protein